MTVFEKVENDYPPRRIIKINNNNDDLPVMAGQSIKLETSPDGEEPVNETCPRGKAWSVKVFIIVTETDA